MKCIAIILLVFIGCKKEVIILVDNTHAVYEFEVTGDMGLSCNMEINDMLLINTFSDHVAGQAIPSGDINSLYYNIFK